MWLSKFSLKSSNGSPWDPRRWGQLGSIAWRGAVLGVLGASSGVLGELSRAWLPLARIR